MAFRRPSSALASQTLAALTVQYTMSSCCIRGAFCVGLFEVIVWYHQVTFQVHLVNKFLIVPFLYTDITWEEKQQGKPWHREVVKGAALTSFSIGYISTSAKRAQLGHGWAGLSVDKVAHWRGHLHSCSHFHCALRGLLASKQQNPSHQHGRICPG